MKRYFNRITKKILLVNAVCILVELFGFVAIYRGMGEIYKNYKDLINNDVNYLSQMNEISNLIQLEHNAVCNFVLAPTEEQMNVYEKEEIEVRNLLVAMLVDFNRKIKGTGAEQSFHKIYADCTDNFECIEIAMGIKRSGGTATASQYITKNLAGFNQEFTRSVNVLEDYFNDNLQTSEDKLNQYIVILRLTIFLIIIIVIASTLISVLICVRLSSSLEKYKDNLEEEVEKKSEQLLESNRHLIFVQKSTIMGMANLIENRDGDTGEHVKRTSFYVELLARECKKRGIYTDTLTDRYIELLQKAAPMHDIGKIVVPDHILKKPGKLLPEEFDQIKLHAAEGGRIIREVLGNIEEPDYVRMASLVAEGHHEKWNGSGYPYKLEGLQIPLCARIMAIADVFDALVSPRCYKEPMPIDKAFDIIKESAGSHFDPELVDVWLEIKPEVLKVLDSCS